MAKKKIPSIPPGEARFRDPEERNFTIMPNTVFFGYPGLSAGARWLYYLLRAYAWGDKAYSYPTVGGLAKIQAVTEKTIRQRLKELTEAKLITVERQNGFRNVYWIEPLPNTPYLEVRGVAQVGGHVLNRQVVQGIKQDENERPPSSSALPSNDKTALISHLAAEFAPGDPEQSIQTYLSRFPVALITRAAEITRANGNADCPIAYLYGVLRNLAEAEAYRPGTHQHFTDLPRLTDAEYQASLEALDRIRKQLSIAEE